MVSRSVSIPTSTATIYPNQESYRYSRLFTLNHDPSVHFHVLHPIYVNPNAPHRIGRIGHRASSMIELILLVAFLSPFSVFIVDVHVWLRRLFAQYGATSTVTSTNFEHDVYILIAGFSAKHEDFSKGLPIYRISGVLKLLDLDDLVRLYFVL